MSNFSLDKLKAARQIIQMDVRGELDKISKKLQNEGKIGYDASDDGGINTAPVQETSPRNVEMQVNREIIKSSKLPKEILESFKTTNSFEPQGSVLDDINASPLVERARPKQNLTEAPQRQQINTINTTDSSNIDYNLIKAIVESTVKKYVGGIKKTLLSEGLNKDDTPRLQAMKIGEKFSFIDAEGNLFEAKLKFIGNVNKKQ